MDFDEPTTQVQPRPAKTTRLSAAVMGPAQLVVLVGPDAGQRFAVGSDRLVIGRESDCAITLHDDGASRRHARIEKNADGEFVVVDLDSRNGTFVNGERVRRSIIAPGDKVALGAETICLFTRHDRYEERVAQAQKLQALGQLAGGVAHDFNNLLAAILSNIGYLGSRAPALEPDVRDCLGEIETAARRAADLTTQLVSFVRNRPRAHDLVDLADLVNEAATLLARAIPRTVEIKTDIEPGLAVLGDSSMLMQVIMNGGINAGQAMINGGAVRINARKVSNPVPDGNNRPLSPGAYARIEIADNGVGMDPATAERAFQPFFTTKPRGEGTGLGLATVAAIVHDHGGDVALRSVPGMGTRLVAYLPAAPHSRLVEKPPPRGLAPLRGRVMLVEDEELVRKATARLLERMGLQVVSARHGLEALALLAENPKGIDVAILDLDMPTLDGEQTCDRLRTINPELRVIICSGHTAPERGRDLGELDVLGFLHKPYDLPRLWSVLAQALGQHQAD